MRRRLGGENTSAGRQTRFRHSGRQDRPGVRFAGGRAIVETVVVRHEANAAFMAAVGRLTGKAGVALVTSGPGSSNLITGLATATSEGTQWWPSAGR